MLPQSEGGLATNGTNGLKIHPTRWMALNYLDAGFAGIEHAHMRGEIVWDRLDPRPATLWA